jgi:hypothetical protein
VVKIPSQNGNNLMIWPLKLLPMGNFVVTLFPKNLKMLSIWQFVFKKKVIFASF